MIAYDYPLMGFFWSMLIFFIWIMWFMLLFRILIDIFRSPDLGGFAKDMWVIFVIVLPVLGVVGDLFARGGSMTTRAFDEAKAQQAQMDAYVRQAAATSTSTADELSKFAELRSSGVITDAEFAAKKAQLLG